MMIEVFKLSLIACGNKDITNFTFNKVAMHGQRTIELFHSKFIYKSLDHSRQQELSPARIFI